MDACWVLVWGSHWLLQITLKLVFWFFSKPSLNPPTPANSSTTVTGLKELSFYFIKPASEKSKYNMETCYDSLCNTGCTKDGCSSAGTVFVSFILLLSSLFIFWKSHSSRNKLSFKLMRYSSFVYFYSINHQGSQSLTCVV